MDFNLINIAQAQGESQTVAGTGKVAEAKSAGISLDPSVIGFQALNFLVLLIILRAILYKPLLKLLSEREHKIKQGVEHAEKAEILLKESMTSREKMLKEARAEGQGMLESARKSGELVRSEIVTKAQDEAQHIVVAGKQAIDSEKAKALLEVKTQAIDLVLKATEKLLKGKIDAAKDSKLIEEALQSYTK